MASRKNRSRKSNRRSPEGLRRQYARASAWLAARRIPAAVAAVVLLFGASLLGGYRVAEHFLPTEPAATPEPKYARIDDLPDLPKYTEVEPGKSRPTVEEKPRPIRLAPAPADETWRRHAVPFRLPSATPLVAIVIDDIGLDRPRSRRAWELPGPMTMSFLPYARDLATQARAARARGHELMLHLPMEPNGRNDPGPQALLVSLSMAEIRQRTVAALDSFDGYAGVNNHMGSRFTAYRPGMEAALRQFKIRGLMFLDSRTTAQSVGDQLAHELGVPSIVRHVFLDDDDTIEAVRRKLAESEVVARRQGFVVAIGHPHEATLQALMEWLPTVQAKGLALAPASAIVRKRNGWE
ncbi:MAG: divergent polysaccharide deacetylase family protein [Enhydrobacter sp.]|nr:MAG: divergent polysaccharide deacetylase family protein [Enhydrobacter sp.]